MRFLWLIFLCIPLSAQAAEFCTRDEQVDLEFPAGLTGNYDLLGKDAVNGAAYIGTLEIAAEENRYLLTRKSAGAVVNGEGWTERCGPDRTLAFSARYDTAPDATELFCAVGTDGDNYFRVTCYARIAGNEEVKGWEAWFQRHE